MTESVVADFVARLVIDAMEEGTPERGRIVLSRKGLALACAGERAVIPLAGIYDVAVGMPPRHLAEFFSDTVTISYERAGSKHAAIIEAGTENVRRFTALLFKAKLNGTKVRVKHPARVGGRITNERFRPAVLAIKRGAVGFRETENPFTVDLSTVAHFERETREVGGSPRTILSIRHLSNGRTVTSEFTVASERALALFGRYLRLEYVDLVERAAEIEVTEEEMEALVAIYSGGGASLAGVLGVEANYVDLLLDSLREKELIVEGTDAVSLSTQGRMLVSERIEDVNF